MKVNINHGISGSGKRGYTEAQYWIVVDCIKANAVEGITVSDVARKTGISGRTLRDIVSDADGREFVLGGAGNKYRVAFDMLSVKRLHMRWRASMKTLNLRIIRRDHYLKKYGLGMRGRPNGR